MENSPILELQNISFQFKTAAEPILEQFNLTIHNHKKIGLIGPNGSGKTTLFHLIMGLHKPTSGTLLYRGKELTEKEQYRELRQEIGLLFQDADDQLFSPTVIEDVAFGPLNLGSPPQEAKEIALKTLADLGLSEFGDRITHHLSGGEKKLASLATIMAMNPELLLLDEPTNNLDPKTQHTLIHIMRDLDLGYVVISHDYDFLADTCDDIYAISDGQIEQCGKDYLHNHAHAHPHGEQPHQHGH